ncbi:MAG: hypothetical protein ACI92I_000410 [Acidimicrobiales bacterium]|jgi:hypothetical protein
MIFRLSASADYLHRPTGHVGASLIGNIVSSFDDTNCTCSVLQKGKPFSHRAEVCKLKFTFIYKLLHDEKPTAFARLSRRLFVR